MDKLKLHTPDLTAANIEKLAALFPGCVTEVRDEKGALTRAIDFDQLRQELSGNIVEGPRERYHLDWPGKREALLAANAPIAKTLRPCREESVNFDTTKNLFIEGDNLDALKLLQETYLGKVKMISIDPPYNTGSDLIYEDDFTEGSEAFLRRSNQKDGNGNRLVANTESNGRFHSDWLSMLYPRLKLSRNLLREDGVIFLSIDENELANLRRVCDEIFGEENFVGCVSRATGTTTGQDAQKIGASLDYLLIYRRSSDFSLAGLPLDDDDQERFKDEDEKGKYSMLQMRKTGNADKREDRPSMYYPVMDPDGNEVLPIGPGGYESRWRFGREKYQECVHDNLIIWKQSRTGAMTPYVKYYLDGRTKQVSNLWDDLDGNKKGSIEVRDLFGAKIFDNPKPLALIQRALQVSMTGGGVVLDFFAGSATTAHAVMKMNAADGGARKFIMVQLPVACDEQSEAFKKGYKSIAEISKERIRRAGTKVKAENATNAPSLDIGFRVLKIDTSNMADVYYAPDAVKQTDLVAHTDNIKPDRTPEDLLFQVLVDWGVDLSLPITQETVAGKKVFFVDGNALAACFDPKVSEDLVKELAKRRPDGMPLRKVVFRDSSYDSDSVKINVEQIFKLLSPETEVKSL